MGYEAGATIVDDLVLGDMGLETAGAGASDAATTTAVTGPSAIEATTLPALGDAAAVAASVAESTAIPTASTPIETTSLPSAQPADMPTGTTTAGPGGPADPSYVDRPTDLPTDEIAKTGTTTAGPGGEADPYYKSAPDTSIFKPYTGPTGADISGALKSLGVTPFQAGALGLSAYGQYKSAEAQKTLQQELERQAQLTRPAAEKLMSQYQSGTIGAAQEKQITDYTNQQKAAIKQRYAKMGRDPNYDSAAQQEMANLDVQAASMRDTALQNVLSSGLKAAGVTGGPAQQAIMAGYQQDQSAQKAQADFLKALADMQARSGTGTQTTPSAPAQV